MLMGMCMCVLECGVNRDQSGFVKHVDELAEGVCITMPKEDKGEYTHTHTLLFHNTFAHFRS